MTMEKQQVDWNSIAENDALWGILSSDEKRNGKWDVNEFFLTGEKEINALINKVKERGINLNWANALDFGCGVGRLTQAMANNFQHCYGIDISNQMIEMANKYNKFGEKCTYIVNDSDDLKTFSNDFFDLIYSSITLQHIPTNHIRRYISEFIKILKPGGISIFQLISYLPVYNRLQPRRRLYSILRTLGFPEKLLFSRFKLNPIRMSFIPEKELVKFIGDVKGKVLHIEKTRLDNGIISNLYFVTK
jgi:2-polyprenyl-3-methyl-5-hydroxy-6-metoxy-1,4-benzoquinol methylase